MDMSPDNSEKSCKSKVSISSLNQGLTLFPMGAELEIVVELGNLVPRKNLVLQKVFSILRYLQS